MRHFVFGTLALALSLGGVVHPAAQTPTADMSVTVKAEAGGFASVVVARNEMYIADGPIAGVGPRVLTDNPAPPLMFNIRAWKEGQKARVVVYAWIRDNRAPDGATETPIATFAMVPGEKRDVTEAQIWGGPRLTVSAATGPHGALR
jgi:hypothetical protein